MPGANESFDGTLHYSEDSKVILLELTRPFSVEGITSHMIESARVPLICGVLFSGSQVVLLDCFRTNIHTTIGSHSTELIYADYALCAFSESDCHPPVFIGGVIDYGDIIEWAGLSRYCFDTHVEQIGEKITWEHMDTIEADVADGLHLRFSPHQGKITFANYDNNFTLHQCVNASFFYDEPRRWERIMDDVNWLRRAIELGKGCSVAVRKAQYLHSRHMLSEKYGAMGYDRYKPAEVLLGTKQGEAHGSRSHRWEFLFGLTEAIEQGAIHKWFAERENLEPVVDLYTLAYTDRIPSAMALFLNLMQALETYHARFICNRVSDYKERVDRLADTSDSDFDVQEFLCDKGQRDSRSIYLKSRISDLLYAEGKLPVKPKRMCLADFSKKLVDTRNYYTHYSNDKKEKAFTQDELPVVNFELMALIEYHLLITLGFCADIAAERVRRRLVDRVG